MLTFESVMSLQAGESNPAGVYSPKIVDKPWGREVWWADEDVYAGKILAVKAGQRLSLQYHNEKKETLYVLTGQVRVLLGDAGVKDPAPEQVREVSLLAGRAFTIIPGTLHRFTAETDTLLLEVSTPHLTDVVRVQDDYKRD